jgi:PAS domain S-box-containing protein
MGTVVDMQNADRNEGVFPTNGELAERALAELQSIYASAPIGMCVLDLDLRYQRLNARLAEINGVPAADHIGRSIHEVVPELASQLEPLLRESIRTRQPRRDIEISGTTAAQPGVVRYWIHGHSPVTSATGEVIGINVVAQEITDRKRAEVQLAEQARELGKKTRELERSNAELEQFASVVSHDLRSPLVSLQGCAELLQEQATERLEPEDLELLGLMRESVGRMADLIRNLLDYARLGSKGLQIVPCDCAAILQGVLRPMRAIIRESDAQVTSDPLPTVPADETLLTRLFQNLVDNALKYRGAAPPRVHISSRHEDEGWVFSFADNGIGVAPQFHGKIFQIFQRLHKEDSRYTGSGMGLAICKKAVEQHGGRMWLESTPELGSTFFFTLPDLPYSRGT